jgi:hypothetical protein
MNIKQYFAQRSELDKSKVERGANIPTNSLHKHLKGHFEMTPKNKAKLIEYLKKQGEINLPND